jgi:hypothetical protein
MIGLVVAECMAGLSSARCVGWFVQPSPLRAIRPRMVKGLPENHVTERVDQRYSSMRFAALARFVCSVGQREGCNKNT